MAWICPCGKSNSDNRRSCKSCGYQLREQHGLTQVGINCQRPVSEEQRKAQQIGIEWYPPRPHLLWQYHRPF
jgi:hypothetical protein